MKVYQSTREASGNIKNAVVTTGSFDGVHIGHKVIINRLNQLAREINGESVLITFHPHPRKVLYPEQKDLKLINSQDEKIELLTKAGLDHLVIIPFSLEFSRTSSHDFISDILVEQLHAKIVVVGHNHHFGHNRQGDYSYLHRLSEELGFDVEEIPLQDIENETVSSTKIRKALMEGNIQRANAYLDHQYIIKGLVGNGGGIPAAPELHTITLDVEEQEKLIPPPGIYASNVLIEGKWLKSMTFIIENEKEERQLETHLIYDSIGQGKHPATLYFYKKVMGGNLTDNHFTRNNILDAKEMVEDLIY
jgi:riboflavin kinase / FMN adenylyltransferase